MGEVSVWRRLRRLGDGVLRLERFATSSADRSRDSTVAETDPHVLLYLALQTTHLGLSLLLSPTLFSLSTMSLVTAAYRQVTHTRRECVSCTYLLCAGSSPNLI